jgi:hypothetical protein
MKKTIILTGAVCLFFTASLYAQVDPTPPQPNPATPETEMTDSNVTKSGLIPMPEPLTTEKIFPAIGKYQLTDKEGNSYTVTATLDQANKGILWVNGLPQGPVKAYLRKSPATYKIPLQKTMDEKDIQEGVLIFDKENNVMEICIGCEYNMDNPSMAFSDEQPVAEEEAPKKSSKKKETAKVKPAFYSGSKLLQETVSLEVNAPVQ